MVKAKLANMQSTSKERHKQGAEGRGVGGERTRGKGEVGGARRRGRSRRRRREEGREGSYQSDTSLIPV